MTAAPPSRAPAPDEVLDRLDPEQREVALAVRGPVVVLAGAGTGKTRAITHRIAYAAHAGIHDPRHTLAVTFTAKAAGEMRARLAGLGVEGVAARTFHAAALRQLTYFWPRVSGGPLPRLMDTKAPVVAAAASRSRVDTDRAVVRDLSAEIEWAKVSGISPADYAAAVTSRARFPDGVGPASLRPDELAEVYRTYESLKADRGLIDFEDVLLLTVGLLETRPDVADTVRSQYRHLTVDEYQDVNLLQQRLLELWLGDRDDLCVVGDPSQTIYTFAGADPRHLLRFRARYPHATEVRLVRSYRSTPQVLELANRILASARGESARSAVRLQTTRDTGPAVTVTAYDDDAAEAAGVATTIRRLVDQGVAPRGIAVLYRINAQSGAFEEALEAAGVPYVVSGGTRFFERPEVRSAVTLLRGAARAASSEPGALVDEVVAVLASLGWSRDSPAAGAAGREKWEALAALVDLAADLAAADPTTDLTALVADLERRAATAHAPVADGVTLASLHAAKGLEWDAVVVAGCVMGLLPHREATTADAVEEERRLLYVGVTRARTYLHLTWSRARSGQRGSRARSFLLDDALGSRDDAPTGEASVRRGSPRSSDRRAARRRTDPVKCRVCGKGLVTGKEAALGRCLSCPSTYDEAVLDALKAWRRTEAARIAKPAYVVFTDATLQALAEAMPTDAESLARVSGIGPAKRDRWGECLLALLRGDPPPPAQDPPQTGDGAP